MNIFEPLLTFAALMAGLFFGLWQENYYAGCFMATILLLLVGFFT
jgi:hypothetical protein